MSKRRVDDWPVQTLVSWEDRSWWHGSLTPVGDRESALRYFSNSQVSKFFLPP